MVVKPLNGMEDMTVCVTMSAKYIGGCDSRSMSQTRHFI